MPKLLKPQSVNDFYSTKSLEKQIINRKVDETSEKIEWLKMLWLNFKTEQPFKINYKYSNCREFQFNCVNVAKRHSKLIK